MKGKAYMLSKQALLPHSISSQASGYGSRTPLLHQCGCTLPQWLIFIYILWLANPLQLVHSLTTMMVFWSWSQSTFQMWLWHICVHNVLMYSQILRKQPSFSIFKVFVSTSLGSQFSGEEIPKFLHLRPEKLFPNGSDTAGMRLCIWFEGCKRSPQRATAGRHTALSEAGLPQELNSLVSHRHTLLWQLCS